MFCFLSPATESDGFSWSIGRSLERTCHCSGVNPSCPPRPEIWGINRPESGTGRIWEKLNFPSRVSNTQVERDGGDRGWNCWTVQRRVPQDPSRRHKEKDGRTTRWWENFVSNLPICHLVFMQSINTPPGLFTPTFIIPDFFTPQGLTPDPISITLSLALFLLDLPLSISKLTVSFINRELTKKGVKTWARNSFPTKWILSLSMANWKVWFFFHRFLPRQTKKEEDRDGHKSCHRVEQSAEAHRRAPGPHRAEGSSPVPRVCLSTLPPRFCQLYCSRATFSLFAQHSARVLRNLFYLNKNMEDEDKKKSFKTFLLSLQFSCSFFICFLVACLTLTFPKKNRPSPENFHFDRIKFWWVIWEVWTKNNFHDFFIVRCVF